MGFVSVQMEVGMDIDTGIGIDADRDTAEADAIMCSHREWAAVGRPGAVSHDEFMAELLHG
jgi:hypothetical protein